MSNGYVDTFVEEGREHLTEIDNNLIQLENNPDDEEAMNQIFRSAHTLKGNAGAMGFENFNELAHAMEDVLDEIRDGAVEVETDVMDDLFDAADAMREMLDEIEDDGDTTIEPQEEIDSLRSIIEEAEEDDTDQCIALTQSGDRCSRNAKSGEEFCGQHLAKIEEEGEDAVDTIHDQSDEEDTTPEEIEVGDTDALIEAVEAPDETVSNAYHVTLTIEGDEGANETVLDAMTDAFNILATAPEMDRVRSDYTGSFSTILIGNIDAEDEITGWFGSMESVVDTEVEEISDRVDWAEGTTELDDAESEDDIEIEDIEDVDSLVGTGEFDEVEEVDEDMVDDVELGMDEVGEAGTFDEAEVDEPAIEDEDEGDEEEDLPDNKGARIFNELEDEVDEADDFDEIEQEMEEMGFGEEFDEMDTEEEVEFDELVESEPGEFDFEDDGEEEAEDTGPGLFDEDELDDAAQEETAGLFDEDEEETEEVEEEPVEEPVETSEEEPVEEVEADSEDEQPAEEGVEVETDEESEDTDEGIEMDVDTGIDLSDEETSSGLLDEEDVSTEADADPFEETAEEPEVEETSQEPADAEADTGVEQEPEPETGSVESEVGGLDDDIFGSEFDDEGGVEFEDLLREAGEDVTAEGDESEDSIDSIRVDVEQLDELYSLVQELVTSRIRLRRAIGDGGEGHELAQAFDELDTLETITTRMQDTVMDIRLVRLERITDRLPRVVRDTARENDKEVDFQIEGEDVELDRAILEQLGDPLMHIVRNAVDHGIEDPDARERADKPREGTLQIRARRTRDRVTIKIEDDGGGIDPQEVRQTAIEEGILTEDQAQQLSDDQVLDLIFHPGFTTSEEVSETSGRGVGLDVVYTTVRSLDGSVDVSSTPGEGTTFTLRLPVSLAIDEVLLIEAGGEEYGIPIKNISEISGVHNIEEVNGQPSHIHNDDVYPVLSLDEELGTPAEVTPEDGRLIRVDKGVRQIALLCDDVIESTEVVVEPYDGVLRTVPGLSGAAVLGEGDVVNILDVERL